MSACSTSSLDYPSEVFYLPQGHSFPFLTPRIHLINWSMDTFRLLPEHHIPAFVKLIASWERALNFPYQNKCIQWKRSRSCWEHSSVTSHLLLRVCSPENMKLALSPDSVGGEQSWRSPEAWRGPYRNVFLIVFLIKIQTRSRPISHAWGKDLWDPFSVVDVIFML